MIELAARRHRPWRRHVVRTLLALPVILVLAELYARASFPYIAHRRPASLVERAENGSHLLMKYGERGRRYKPGADVVIHNERLSGEDVYMRINSHGVRNEELDARPAVGELRILALGDSVTAGGYLQAEQSYVERVESYLAEAWTLGPVEVVNGALGNIGLSEAMTILDEVGPLVAPGVVMLSFYPNDGNPPWGFSTSVATRSWWRRYSVAADAVHLRMQQRRWLQAEASAVFAWVRAADELDWRHDPDALRELAQLARFDWGAAWLDKPWARVEAEFSKLQTRATDEGFRVVVVAFPVVYQVEAEYMDDSPQQRLEAIARTAGFYYLDLLPVLREHAHRELFYDHAHLDPDGNELVGRTIADFLAGSVLPELRDGEEERGGAQ